MSRLSVELIESSSAPTFSGPRSKQGLAAPLKAFMGRHEYYSMFFFRSDLERAKDALLSLSTATIPSETALFPDEFLSLVGLLNSQWTIAYYGLHQKRNHCLEKPSEFGAALSDFICSDFYLLNELNHTLPALHHYSCGEFVERRTIEDRRLKITKKSGSENAQLPKEERDDDALHFYRVLTQIGLPILDATWNYRSEPPRLDFFGVAPGEISGVTWFVLRC